MAGCCGFCAPRYKRLVDNVFPRDSEDGLAKVNMEKLTFYVLSSPEKLDRVGEYLYQKLSRDINRRRNGLVVIGVEAMDQLLQACHSQSLNLFVESFLRMVQKLLESPDPNLQILAVESFVKFANIEEDTPSYHRRYDFFVSKFSSMCHNNAHDDVLRHAIRTAGIQGLKSVVRKTVSDELVENIWDPSHLEKIIPSLLFNMEQGRKSLVARDETDLGTDNGGDDEVEAPKLAEFTIRDLVNKATFGHVRGIVKPVLQHFDANELWVPNDFAVYTFRVIMFSIQSQYSYAVIETLMNHLEQHNYKSNAKVRTSMADVLSKIIAIAAGESVGPSVLEIVNAIVQLLNESTKVDDSVSDEKTYRETLILALGEYVTHLPDYQKIEIMKFIMQKVPSRTDRAERRSQRILRNMLLKSLLVVGTKYHTTYLSTTFPVSFLQPLLTLSQHEDNEVRLLVQNILHTLIDRHNNKEKLASPSLKLEGIVRESCTRTDILFAKKNGTEIFTNLFGSLERPNNTIKNMNAVYRTVALFCVELYCEDTLFDLIRFALSFQDLAISSSVLTPAQRIHMHVITLALLYLLSQYVHILKGCVDKVIKARKEHAIHLLPPLKSNYAIYEPATRLHESCLLSQETIWDALKRSGLEPSTKTTSYSLPRHSWVDAHIQTSSSAELHTVSIDDDSAASSPESKTVPKSRESLTVDNLKQILTESPETRKEFETKRCQDLTVSFKLSSFDDLIAKAAAREGNLQNRLSEIFTKIGAHRSLPFENVDGIQNKAKLPRIQLPHLFDI